MNAQDLKVFKEIATELADSLPGWPGIDAQLDTSQIPSLRVHAHSFIARYTARQEHKPVHLLVKIPHRSNQADLQAALDDGTLRKAAMDEYYRMLDTWQAFERSHHPGCIAVQPLGFLEPWNAIVMLELEARPLRSLLVTPQIWFSQAATTKRFVGYLRKASRWLRHYHDLVGDSKVAPVSSELMTARLDKVAGDVATHLGNRFNAPDYLSMLRERIGKLSGLERIARLHGDFHASNILFTPRGLICVLDPRADIRPRSVYDDLATLLIDLHLKPVPILTGGRFSQKFLEQSRQTVVESYFKRGEYQPALLDFYCACETLFSWSMDERDLVRRRGMRLVAPLARPILTSYVHGVMSHYLQARL